MPTPDCCPAWRHLVASFGWFEFADHPGLFAMPYLDGDGIKRRVNHCPSCGAPRRDVVIERASAACREDMAPPPPVAGKEQP